jgi:hypothetical protein
MAIIDQLPPGEFSKVAQDVRDRARMRSLSSLRKMRTAVRKSGLKKRDFEKALEEVRAAKKTSRSARRS